MVESPLTRVYSDVGEVSEVLEVEEGANMMFYDEVMGRGNAYSFDGPVIADVGVQKL